MNGREMSPPVREAWIEILARASRPAFFMSPPVREAWIEMRTSCKAYVSRVRSPPVREAWIEIIASAFAIGSPFVASREGGVD